MAGQKFQYDESGSTFLYFVLSFLALILIPCTYYFWPNPKVPSEFNDTFRWYFYKAWNDTVSFTLSFRSQETQCCKM